MTPPRHRPWSTWARRCAGLALVSTDVGKVHARNAAHVEKIKSAVVTRWSRGGHTVVTRWSQPGGRFSRGISHRRRMSDCTSTSSSPEQSADQPCSSSTSDPAARAAPARPPVAPPSRRRWGMPSSRVPTVDEWRTAHPRRRRPSDQPISVAQNPQSPPWRRWDQHTGGRPARAHAGGTHEKGRARPALFHAGRR